MAQIVPGKSLPINHRPSKLFWLSDTAIVWPYRAAKNSTQRISPVTQLTQLVQTAASTFSAARSKSSHREMSNGVAHWSGLPQKAAPIVRHSFVAEAIVYEPTAESRHGERMAPASEGVLCSPTEYDDRFLLEPRY